MRPNMFADDPPDDASDRLLVAEAQHGSREALERLIERHQAWVYNLALRMLYHPEDAEDAAQEVLVKAVTKLSSFQGHSRFRTWLYRIAVNHVLNTKRGRLEPATMNFADFGRSLDRAPDADLPDPRTVPVDVQLLVDEARIGCTSGMLLCLDREQRLVYVLGEIFGASDAVGAELVGISRANFRQKLARARRDLHNFMNEKCGLVNTTNPCRCAKKTQAFIRAGYVNPEKLLFARQRVLAVKQVAAKTCADVGQLDDEYAEVFRAHPFQDSPDLVAALRALLARPDVRRTLELQ